MAWVTSMFREISAFRHPLHIQCCALYTVMFINQKQNQDSSQANLRDLIPPPTQLKVFPGLTLKCSQKNG